MKHIPVIQLGMGGVGRPLVEQVLDGNARWQEREGLRFDYLAIADSRQILQAHPALTEPALRTAIEAKQAGQGLGSTVPKADLLSLLPAQPTLLVDVSGADDTTPLLLAAAQLGHRLVLANKKPLAGEWSAFRALIASGTRYEATVGAGLPIISTLQSLLDTGDEVREVAGCFSGTLGFVLSEVEQGRPFSQAVLEAKARGWTEPDPRDDLSGIDVARKALILARTLGYRLDLVDLPVEALFTPAHARLSSAEFLAALPELDVALAERMQTAQAQGMTLRYVARLGAGKVRVGLREVPQHSPLGGLQGPDNLISFNSHRYADQPLVVRGPGAGAERTAAGVLADMLTLARQASWDA